MCHLGVGQLDTLSALRDAQPSQYQLYPNIHCMGKHGSLQLVFEKQSETFSFELERYQRKLVI